MYSVVMVVAMAAAPEAPTCCCWKDCCYKSCCNKNDCGNKSCCDKNYAPAAPVAVAPAPVKVAPAPVAVAPTQDCGKSNKGCCLDCLCCWKKCCDKGNYAKNDCGTKNDCGNKGDCCSKGGSSSKGCCFCCDKGGYSGAVVVPVETPKKDMPKVESKAKVGG